MRLQFAYRSYVLILLFTLTSHAISLEMFDEVNTTLVTLFEPAVRDVLSGELELNPIYDLDGLKSRMDGVGGYFNRDSALKFGSRFVITLTGMIPRQKVMVQDGYALIACHEFGHLLGGAPRQTKPFVQFSSVEGQADYWATNICMWKYLASLKSSDVIHSLDPYALKRCNDHYGHKAGKYLACLRIMSGMEAMVEYFNLDRTALGESADLARITLDGRDKKVVDSTLEKYGSLQCRVMTWVAGLFNEPPPRCWYAPENSEPKRDHTSIKPISNLCSSV